MAYKIPSRFTKKEREKYDKILADGVTSEKSTTEIIKEAKKEGLSYRRTNMLHDIRRKESEYWRSREKDPETGEWKDTTYHEIKGEGKQKSLNFFDNVFEKYRDEKNLNSKQATKLWEMTRSQTAETEAEAYAVAEFWDFYKSEFGD